MKRLWTHKWLVIVGTVTIFLSVGAIAWAATGDEPDTYAAGEVGIAAGYGLAAAGNGDGSATADGPAAAVKKAAAEKRQQWLKKRAALMEELREEMTAADQALYDKLVATAKKQREALQEARQELSETLKQLRDLGKKYRGAGTDTTG
jgi:Ni,Fe-hydrogenase I large subunit